MTKKKPSLCNVFDIMGKMMMSTSKKFFLKRHSSKNLMCMNARSKSKGVHTFCPAHWTIISHVLLSRITIMNQWTCWNDN